MKANLIIVAALVLIAAGVVVLASRKHNALPVTSPLLDPRIQRDKAPKSLNVPASQLTEAELDQVRADFETHLKPAFSNWCRAYAGHIPFDPAKLTADKFVARFGRADHVFVVDDVTVSIRYAKDVPSYVSYLNTKKGSAKLNDLPSDGKPPNVSIPVSRAQVTQMLEADSGIHYAEDKIRMNSTALSSSMGGGVHIEVGGNPDDFLSWEFVLVFGPDTNLAYYQTGAFKPSKPKS